MHYSIKTSVVRWNAAVIGGLKKCLGRDVITGSAVLT